MTAHTALRPPNRLCRSLLAGLALAVLALPAALPAAKAEKPVWPANVRVVEARLSLDHFKGDSTFSLPQLRAYDRAGRQLYSTSGYDDEKFKPDFRALLASRKPQGKVDPKMPLSADLAKLESPTGGPFAAPPPADITLIKYWADWCVPCHAQTRDLVEVLKAHPGVEITLVHVDADITKQRPKKQAG